MEAPNGMIFTVAAASARVSSGAAAAIDARLRSPIADVKVVVRTMADGKVSKG